VVESPSDAQIFGAIGRVAYDAERDLVQCHLCGRWLKWISGLHILMKHGVTVDEYRRVLRIPPSESLMAAST
jgi:hypothetical protein